MDRIGEGIITADIDLEQMDAARREWGLFRDRRPGLYQTLMTSDGMHRYSDTD
jgi:N-carbamoylputrescine amidase